MSESKNPDGKGCSSQSNDEYPNLAEFFKTSSEKHTEQNATGGSESGPEAKRRLLEVEEISQLRSQLGLQPEKVSATAKWVNEQALRTRSAPGAEGSQETSEDNIGPCDCGNPDCELLHRVKEAHKQKRVLMAAIEESIAHTDLIGVAGAAYSETLQLADKARANPNGSEMHDLRMDLDELKVMEVRRSEETEKTEILVEQLLSLVEVLLDRQRTNQR